MRAIDNKVVDELIEWMVEGARPSANAGEIIDGICTRLTRAGLPISRFALFIYALHPSLVGYRFVWTPEAGTVKSEGKIGLFSTEEYTLNRNCSPPRVFAVRI